MDATARLLAELRDALADASEDDHGDPTLDRDERDRCVRAIDAILGRPSDPEFAPRAAATLAAGPPDCACPSGVTFASPTGHVPGCPVHEARSL